MNRLLAEQIIGIEHEPIINQELIKKYFRKKASEIHPDKFQLEPEKLKATKRFIQLKNAYDFLLDYLSVNGEYKNPIFDNRRASKEVWADNTYQSTYKSTHRKHEENDSWYNYLYLLIFPGVMLPIIFFGTFYLIYTEEKKTYEGSVMYWIMIPPQVLLLLFSFLAGGYYIIKYALEGRIFYLILLIQMGASLCYYLICYLKRKFLEYKYLRNSGLSPTP